MNQAALAIYTPPHRPGRLTIQGRLLAAGLALGCLTLLIVAARLTPDPSGTGSHRELGLASCQFLARTGLPCPTCGMTTSWTWFVRGDLAASFYVQPMGTVLAFIAVCCFWGGMYVAVTGRPAYRALRAISGQRWFIALLGFALAAWAWKIAIHLGRRDGW